MNKDMKRAIVRLLMVVVFMVINLLVDIVYAVIDPRIRLD